MFKVTRTPALILDFDTECRPMHYNEWRPESQITAIAWSWGAALDGHVYVELLEPDGSNEAAMLRRFLLAYVDADVVTGHYVRKHDLPLLNDHYVRLGMPPLLPRMVQDTQADMTAIKGLGKSQDNLATTFGLASAKHHMTGADWRLANQLSEEGAEMTKKRVVDDVRQHMELREAMVARGLLKPPRMWAP
jgi:DNA polymerase elongation subunit (family B)